MPHLDASSLDSDPDGLGFLRATLDSGAPAAAGPPAAVANALRDRERQLAALQAASAHPSFQLMSEATQQRRGAHPLSA